MASLLGEAIGCHQAGDLDGAQTRYARVLEINPDHPHALHLLGVIRHQRGANDEAVALIERAIALNPDYGDYYINLGAALFAQKRLDEAEARFRKAAQLNPLSGEAHSNLAAVLADKGQIDDAILAYEAAHRINPGVPRFLKRLADLHLAQEQFGRAIERFTQYLALVPDDAEVHNNLGYAHERKPDLAAAERCYRRACELAPDSPEINNNLGSVLYRLDRRDEADRYFERALSIQPDKWEDLANRAGTYVNRRELDRALPLYRQLLEAQPDNAKLHNDYGVALSAGGVFGEAAQVFQRAITLDPSFPEAYNNLGSVRLNIDDTEGAISAFRKAIELKPRYLDAHINICLALLFRDRLDEAYLYAKGTTLLEDYRSWHFTNPHKVFRTVCDFVGIEELGDAWANVEQAPANADVSANFLEMTARADTPDKIERLANWHKKWGSAVSRRAAPRRFMHDGRTRNRKLRIGFLSSDLRRHSVTKFLLPILAGYDHDKFEIYCYTPYNEAHDEVQQLIKGMVAEFRIQDGASEYEIAQAIHADNVDILFELNGFTKGTRLKALAYKPAPVQIYWLGYPFTTGIPEIDYIMADPLFKPENEGWLVEKPMVMPQTWVCFSSFVPEPITATPPFERNGVVTFGTLNNPYKFTADMIGLWAQVLNAVPNSRFLLVRPECSSVVLCANIAKEFAKYGIPPERVYFVNNKKHDLSHFSYYDEIDVSLDTFPVQGGTTTCDALWMGVPVVSLIGPSMHQRLALSLLTNAGLGDLCAYTPEDYVKTAIALANDQDRLRALRTGLRQSLQTTPLCDAPRYVRALEQRLLEIADKHGLR